MSDDSSPEVAGRARPGADEALAPMEIGPDRSRRWAGWVGYLLFIAVVAGAFIWLFAHFTLSWKIATGVVAVMLTYMVLMAWWAGRGGVGGGGMSS